MGYIDRLLGDSERVQYSTHRHVIVLIQRTVLWLLTFLLFLGIGLVILFWPEGDQGTRIRWWIGLIALVSLLVPVSVVVVAWRRGRRRSPARCGKKPWCAGSNGP